MARLKQVARQSQPLLISLLESEKAAGRARRIRPLWLGNVVGVEATPEVVRRIASLPEVDHVHHDPPVSVMTLGLEPICLDLPTANGKLGATRGPPWRPRTSRGPGRCCCRRMPC